VAQSPNFNQSDESKPKPTESQGPKRGAIPTPKAEIERAKPYVIENDCEVEDQPPLK
jgi:hypothetical protein